MASDGVPATVPVSVVQISVEPAGGKSLPRSGNAVHGTAVAASASANVQQPQSAAGNPDLRAVVAQLNKYLNDSGRPNQFRVNPMSRGQTIQEINPATGEVIGEFSASEFPALARSLGVSGVLVDSRA